MQESCALLVPVLSLGRRLVATARARAGTVALAAPAVTAGGLALRPTRLLPRALRGERDGGVSAMCPSGLTPCAVDAPALDGV